MKKIISRIGISPVGSSKYRINRLRLHLLAFVVARKAQIEGRDAEFIIRCDDSDTKNSHRSFLDAYLEVLDSLGVNADRIPYDRDDMGQSLFQSERHEIYQEFVSRLLIGGLAYQDSSGAIFFNVKEFSQQFRDILKENKLSVHDVSMGDISVDVRSPMIDMKGGMDFVPFPLVRADGGYLFNLCSPVDDAVMGVTHVVRDRDKLSLLAKQEMVRIALHLPSLEYMHVPLIVNKEGKRFVFDENYGDATLQDFFKGGIIPKALVSYLLSSVYGRSESYYASIDEFSAQINFSKIHQSNTVFSSSVLEQHNKKALESITEEEYEENVKIFFENEDHNRQESRVIVGDLNMVRMLGRMRRSLPESWDIARSIIFPVYDALDAEHSHAVHKIIEFLTCEDGKDGNSVIKSYGEDFVLNADKQATKIGLSKREYYQALRYVFTGKYHGCNLSEIMRYFEESDIIESRIRMTQQEILKSELSVTTELKMR